MFLNILLFALLVQTQFRLGFSMPTSVSTLLKPLFARDNSAIVYADESEVPPEVLEWGYGKLEEAEEDEKTLPGRDVFIQPHLCYERQDYNISHSYAIEAAPALVAGVVCNATYSGCSIGDTLGYAVTVTTTLGFHLDIAKIFGLGIQGDVSEGTTNAEAVTISESCPPGFTCGIQAVAHMQNVTGWEMTTHGARSQGCSSPASWQKYEVHYPLKVNNSQPNAQAWVEYSICLQHNSVNEYKRPIQIPLCPPFPDNDANRDFAKIGS